VTQIDYGKHEQTVKELDRQEKEQEYERDLVESFCVKVPPNARITGRTSSEATGFKSFGC